MVGKLALFNQRTIRLGSQDGEKLHVSRLFLARDKEDAVAAA